MFCFQFDDSLLANLLRIIQHMQLKKKDITNAKTLSDDKELLRETLPALAMPNVDANKLMTELEGLQPKWKEEKVCLLSSLFLELEIVDHVMFQYRIFIKVISERIIFQEKYGIIGH